MNHENLGRDKFEPGRLSIGDFIKKLSLCHALWSAMKSELASVDDNESKNQRKWPHKAPAKFLKRSDGQERKLLPLRNVGEFVECARCSVKGAIDEIGSKLTTFVCRTCRNDNQEWNYAGQTVESMSKDSPDCYYTSSQSGEGRN